MEEDGVLGVNLGQVLLGDVDVGRGVGVHGLLPALQHLLFVIHLPQLHLTEFYKTKSMLKELLHDLQ